MPNTDTRRSMRQSYVALFAQDEWRPTNDLTLSYGLRYEFFTVPNDTQGRVAGLLSFNDLESGPQGVTPATDTVMMSDGSSCAYFTGRSNW